LLPKKAKWDAADAAYENHTTRNRNITFAKTEKRKAYEKPLRILVRNLQCNVFVTQEDLCGMGVALLLTSRPPALVATTYPSFDVDSGTLFAGSP
jgi:hypothetical protein